MLIPIGTKVIVTRRPIRLLNGEIEDPEPPFPAIVRGYDIHRTKYQLGREYLPGMFTEGISWAFLQDVVRQEEGRLNGVLLPTSRT